MIEEHQNKSSLNKLCKSILTISLATVLVFLSGLTSGFGVVTAYAKETDSNIAGELYEFGEKDTYAFSTVEKSSGTTTYGHLNVSGDIAGTSQKDGISAYAVKSGNLAITYSYNDSLLNAKYEDWHLVDDKGKKVDTISLDDKIMKGALILQTSKDGKIWVDSYKETNIFENVPSRTDSFATTTEVQLANGCYYRVIVAYETRRKVDPTKVLFLKLDNYEYKKYTEVYEFYAFKETIKVSETADTSKKYNLGSQVRTEKFEGYYGSTTIDSKDPHYGWDLGQFFLSGYTDNDKDPDGNVVFLKNVGDQITLWFNLQQDINCLNGNDAITIEEDGAGSDQYFETAPTDFGHGALIVRKTDSENIQGKPQIYTNYLEATATVGADTKVDLFEEGDYEVALNYAIKYDKTKIFGASVLPIEAHYRIFFKFSVRNSNSMFYPRDVITKSELANNATTAKGFSLDLANSKYLKLNIVREVLKDGAKGLSEDVRFNKAAKDGDKFTDEGIYTITVTNQYTEKSTTKKIYVGEDEVLRAYMTTGLPIGEIRDKIAMGAAIAYDGTIIEPVPTEQETTVETVFLAATEKNDLEESDESTPNITVDEEPVNEGDKNNTTLPIVVVSVIIVAAVSLLAAKKKKGSKKNNNQEGE